MNWMRLAALAAAGGCAPSEPPPTADVDSAAPVASESDDPVEPVRPARAAFRPWYGLSCEVPVRPDAGDPCGADAGCTVAVVEGSCELLGHIPANRCYARANVGAPWTDCGTQVADLLPEGSNEGDATVSGLLNVGFVPGQALLPEWVAACWSDRGAPPPFEFARWGMHDRTSDVDHVACADPELPGRWGGRAGGVTWMNVDTALAGCVDALSAAGVEPEQVPGFEGDYVAFSGLAFATVATGDLAEIRAALSAAADPEPTEEPEAPF